MKLCIIGTGYVGLVSGVCFAELGFDVTCVDHDMAKLEHLQRGHSPIYEPGLDALIGKNMKAGRLHVSSQLKQQVTDADIIFIAVGTPPDAQNHSKADLSFVFAAATQIAEALDDRHRVIVTKSTVPVGTNAAIKSLIAKTNPDALFDVVSNPEFLREGSAIDDFMKPDRIVVGVESDRAGHLMADLYQPLTNKGYSLLRTDVETAEMIKYASNAFLATKIAFINEMADICEHVGANVELVAKGMGMDARIGERFLRPGPGFGGSCFPKDAMALAQLAKENGIDPRITNAVIHYNLGRRESMAGRVIAACDGSVKGKNIAIFGLTFKANTDDMRESPSLSIVPQLLAAGAHLRAYDPEGMENAKRLLTGAIEWCDSWERAADKADACVIVTEWQTFRDMDMGELKTRMKQPRMIDLRNLFVPETMAKLGFDYYSIGRKPALRPKSNLAA